MSCRQNTRLPAATNLLMGTCSYVSNETSQLIAIGSEWKWWGEPFYSHKHSSEFMVVPLSADSFCRPSTNWSWYFDISNTRKIRPHRFRGEGVLIGVQTATLNPQVTFVDIAVAISASAGGGLKIFAPKPFLCWCFCNFWTIFACQRSRRYGERILGRFEGGPAMEKRTWDRLPATKNGQKWKKKKKLRNIDVFKGFGMLENWTHCKTQCFGPTLYWRTRKLCCFWRKDWNNTVRTCVLDRLYAQTCINYVGFQGKQSKDTAKNIFWSMFNMFTRTEPKNLRCGRPPTRSGVNMFQPIIVYKDKC